MNVFETSLFLNFWNRIRFIDYITYVDELSCLKLESLCDRWHTSKYFNWNIVYCKQFRVQTVFEIRSNQNFHEGVDTNIIPYLQQYFIRG